MSIQTALSRLFSNAGAIGVKGIFQFMFSSNCSFWVDCQPNCVINCGTHLFPDVSITVSEYNFLSIMQGKKNIEQLFAAGHITITGNLGLATLLPQIVYSASTEDNSLPTLEMNKRYIAPPRKSETISSSPLHILDSCSLTTLSKAEFKSKYVDTGSPVLIKRAIIHWPLFNMNKEEVVKCFLDFKGITRHGDYAQKAFSTERNFQSVPFHEFISTIIHPTEELKKDTHPAYMGNNALPNHIYDYIEFPPYFETSAYISPRIWLGPKGTLTPLHRDDSDNFFAQVWGEKSFLLAAPHSREALRAWSTSPHGGLDGSDFNPDDPDYESFPAAREVTFLRIVLEAGDMLFLPEGWFHQVESLSISLSINFWTNSNRNFLK
ncbi:cupin-like domain-containing protein [Pseudomonas syringae group genomosp. 3]|uniref:Cupin n=1 Tax=Pseudomonas syringae pv. primulae TaxID=251707 RepID=A0A3M3Y9Y9_9PSED|nr:cupin-like domain-containing protein [Pseudomonas syringae group genomosp. 3]RMO79039.1 Cupin [Pseudomonas syringae pv. primulae]RMU38027.1 Cupin [Pseudomonas syringae pv. primulae]